MTIKVPVMEIVMITMVDLYRAPSAEGFSICMRDYDNDGYGDENPNFGVTPGTDCNDSNPDILPVDFDGDGYHSCSGDCNERIKVLRVRTKMEMDSQSVREIVMIQIFFHTRYRW